MGTDAPEAGPDCRPLTWKEVAERASESATARRKEGRDIFRQLRSAEALAQRRGEALREAQRNLEQGLPRIALDVIRDALTSTEAQQPEGRE
jgi:hypothetical protein